MSYAIARSIGERMSTAEWVNLFKHSRLRQYFLDMARALCRDRDLQEDCYQEAWMAVGESPGGKREEYYQEEGLRAMDRYRKKLYPQTRKARYETHKRMRRVVRKYFLKKKPGRDTRVLAQAG